MDGANPAPKTLPPLRRGFEFSRLEQQLLALAYEQLLPIIRSPKRPRKRPTTRPHAGRNGGDPSFQEEPARESR